MLKNTQIFISSSADSLRTYMSQYERTATVEAEYGLDCVEGTLVTLAHHGPRSEQPCPCLAQSMDLGQVVIGVSHFDLDTIGGVMSVLGIKQGSPRRFSTFWETAALVDTLGVHKLCTDVKSEVLARFIAFTGEPRAFEEAWSYALLQLQAFWAWSEGNRLFPPRDGSVQDCTSFFDDAITTLTKIFEGDNGLLDAGRAWAEAKAALAAESLLSEETGVALRQSAQFTNHLYGDCIAVVAHNPQTGAATVSLADPVWGINCCTLMQQLFGPQAGGHAGIAGGPRGLVLGIESARGVAALLAAKLARLALK